MIVECFIPNFLDLHSFACSLLRQGMKQILITLEAREIKQLEKKGDKESIANVYYYHHSFLACFTFIVFSSFLPSLLHLLLCLV